MSLVERQIRHNFSSNISDKRGMVLSRNVENAIERKKEAFLERIRTKKILLLTVGKRRIQFANFE